MQVKKQQLELDIQQTGSKLGKEYVKAVYCHPAYLSYMQSTSCKMHGWMKHKLESRLLGEISITSNTQMIPALWHKVKRNWRGSLVPLHFLPWGWCHLHIWGYWYFSHQSWVQLVLHPAGWQCTTLMYSFPNLEPVSFSMSDSNCFFLICIQVPQEAGKAA